MSRVERQPLHRTPVTSNGALPGDLAATDVDIVKLDLGVAAAGDAAADSVIVNGTSGVDVMSIAGAAGSVTLARPSLNP
jgi:hypothetical protein